MLVKLTKDQVANYWPLIKQLLDAVDLPLTRGDKNKRNKVVLRRLLIEDMICWAITRQDPETLTASLQGFFITSEVTHEVGYDYLYIDFYMTLPDADITGKEFVGVTDTLIEYATNKGYDAVLAHSNVPRVINLAEKFGADSSFRVLMWDLK